MKLARLAFAAPVLAFGTTADAVRNPDYLDERPIEAAAGPPARQARTSSWRAPVAAEPAWKAFLARHGSWIAMWDGETGAPTRIYGEGIAAPGAIADAAVAEVAARRVLDDQLALLAPGAAPSDFVLLANQVHGGGARRTVSYAQHHDGVPVVGAAVSFLFGHDRLFVIGSHAVPHVRATHVAQPISAAVAAAAATTWISDLYGATPSLLGVDARVILPVIRERDDGSGVDYRVVTPVTVDLAEPRARWIVYVDAATGDPVARRQTLMFADGTLKYSAPVRYPGATRADYPAQFASTSVSGSTVLTDADGHLTWAGGVAASVTARVTGTYVAVRSASGSTVTGALTVQPGGSATWNLGSTERSDAQLAAFAHANLIKRFTATTLAPQMTWLNSALSVSVNESGNCNAYSTGDDIHFYVESGQCNNTARLADVVYHEFGHSLHNHAIIPGAGEWDGALSEGVSDYLAATYTDDPKMGRGFFKTDAPLRDLDPANSEWTWPEDNGEVHDAGRIIGGALWDLREAMRAALGDAPGQALADDLYYAVIARASDIPTTYVEALAGDDDDGDLANGTPHKCLIDAAFAAHGLADPGSVAAGSVAPPVLEDRVLSLSPDDATGVCPPPAVASARATWRLRAAPATTGTVDFVASGTGLAASLPDETGMVQYQVTVTFEDGTTQVFPNNAADPWYEAYLGGVTTIWCEDFEGAADGWVLDGFSAGAPMATASASDPAAAFAGSAVLGTDLGELGGDGDYEPSSALSATSPIIEIPGTWDGVRLQYRRWLNVEDATYDHATIGADGSALWENLETAAEDTHHRDREWRFHDVDVTAQAADGAVELTFGLTSDQGLELGGWTMDQVCIVAIGAGVCGDTLVSPGEQCDDGNDVDGDGCSACISDDPPDDPDDPDGPDDPTDPGDATSGCCSTGSYPAGPLALLALVLLGLRRRRR